MGSLLLRYYIFDVSSRLVVNKVFIVPGARAFVNQLKPVNLLLIFGLAEYRKLVFSHFQVFLSISDQLSVTLRVFDL